MTLKGGADSDGKDKRSAGKFTKNQPFSLVLRFLMWIATFLTVGITVCIVGYILIRGIPNLFTGDVCLGI